ncbi:hypothetical protein TrVGV298_011379 [Trichoderma virens]|nr:hypothetical protein TrVGV298_011379 [Trichoderma virens]UKZ83232.1 hypothetical protein TrVFT333_011038 [Trichoderma virens FT-333]
MVSTRSMHLHTSSRERPRSFQDRHSASAFYELPDIYASSGNSTSKRELPRRACLEDRAFLVRAEIFNAEST